MIRQCSSVILIGLLISAARQALPEDVVDLGSRRELFVDGRVVDTLKGARLKLHTPTPAGVALHFDREWEGDFSAYVTVLHDGAVHHEDATYRMYYRGMPAAGGDTTRTEVTCYAESDDGIHWRKPDLGLYEVNQTRQNNVVLADHPPFSHNFSPFIDTRPGVPADERFKALAGAGRDKQTDSGLVKAGLHSFASADGINWRKLGDGPVITDGAFDSQNVAFWSEHEKTYVCYFRTWSEGFRTISRTTSPDFTNWSEPVQMSFGDTAREHLYTNQTHPYFRAPHIYIAVPMRFMPNRRVLTPQQAAALGVHVDPDNPGLSYASDCADAVFMSTRGDAAYDRTFMEAFIRPGTDLGNWASRAGMTALGVVPTGETEMSLYKQAHYAQPTAHLLRYTLRTDGFVSVNGPYQGGEIVTKPLTFTGTALTINFATSAAGSVRFELQTPDGAAIEGFTLNDADPLIGDAIDRTATWQGASDLSEIANHPIRIRAKLIDADWYSFSFGGDSNLHR